MPINADYIRDLLENRYELYNQLSFIDTDPISIPHRFSSKADIEIAGLLTALISWGRRKAIIDAANNMMGLIDHDPYNFVMHHEKSDLAPLCKFVYRTFNGNDLINSIKALQHIYIKYEGLENIFTHNSGIFGGLVEFRRIVLQLHHERRFEKHIANVAGGAAAKRLNMFLRWMVRNDRRGVDFGIWTNISASQLYIPLDVHTGQVARKMQLLTRNANDWKAVLELTSTLGTFDPDDPVKYDFALFGLGVFEDF